MTTPPKPTFYASVHCTAGVHCATCRNTGAAGQAFRAAMLTQFPELGGTEFPCPQDRRWGWQLGDLVAKVATPIARALKLDCIDPQKRQLKPESKCAQRRARLNALRLGGQPAGPITPITAA